MVKNNVICIQEKRIDILESDFASTKQNLVDIKDTLKRLEDNQNSFFKWLLTILGTVILSLVF